MDADLVMTVGVVIGVLSVPAFFASITGDRSPRMAALLMAFAALCIVAAVVMRPGGYAITDIPGVMLSVAKRFF